MVKFIDKKPQNHIDNPYENGAVGAIASVASAGVALGAGLGSAAGLPGLQIGAAIGGVLGLASGLMIAEHMDRPVAIIPIKKTA